jgi:hypothetical protein
MSGNTKNEWQYQCAFVIRFHPETDFAAGRCAGRVEHVATYEATRFHSVEDLLLFISRLLKDAQDGLSEAKP